MSDIEQIDEIIDSILLEGRKLADEVEVYCVEGRAVQTELKRSVVGEALESEACGIGIRTITDGRIGISSVNNPKRWKACLTAAIESGSLATPQEWHGLPKPADVSRTVPIFDPALEVDIAIAHELVSQMLDGASMHPADVTGGYAVLSRGSIRIANSNGVYYRQERTGAGVALETIKETSTGYEFERSCFLDINPREVGEKAAFYAVHSSKGTGIESGQYDVILSPLALAQLLDTVVVPALSGRNVKAGRSFLAGRLGEQCMDTALSLLDDPFARGLGSTAFDAEGMPTRRLEFVKNGILECFAYDLKTAYRYGEESTASAIRAGPGGSPSIGVHNLVIDGPRRSVDEERAIFIHNLVGAHTANPISGDFSVELSNPSWMEGGSFAEPIRSGMLAGNIFAMLTNIGGIGRDTRVIGSAILPSVRFNNLQIIGK